MLFSLGDEGRNFDVWRETVENSNADARMFLGT
jgi:hypothetical protein